MTRPEQLDIEGVRRLSPAEVDEALRGGKLDDLLGRPSREPEPPPLTAEEVERAAADGRLGALLERHRNWQPTERERLAALAPEEVRDALANGELDDLLGRARG